MRLRLRFTSLILALSLTIPCAAQAQMPGAAEGLSLSVGPGLLVLPDYPGADTYDVTPIPAAILTYGDWLFIDPARGAGAQGEILPGVSASGGLDYAFGRDESDSPHLAGMGDLDGGLSGFGAVSLRPFGGALQALSFDTRVEAPFTGDIGGAEITTDLTATLLMGDGLLSVRAGAAWMTGAMMDDVFGVTAAQAAGSTLPAYDPGGGLKSWRLGATFLQPLGGRLSLAATGGYDRLAGDAGRSPVVQSRDQFYGAAAIVYRFGR